MNPMPALTTTIAPDLASLLIAAVSNYESFHRGGFFPATAAAHASRDRLVNLLQQANPWDDHTVFLIDGRAYGWEECNRSRKGVRLIRFTAVAVA
jgi:hypothetical protein